MTPRKAFVMAAGTGSRLGERTRKTPKCLLPVAGEPVIHWSLRSLASAGVEEALVNTHHLSAQVEAYLAARGGAPRARAVREPRLLGSAGTVRENSAFTAGEEAVWVLYADTLIEDDLTRLWGLHRARASPLTLGLFRSPAPEAGGVAELGPDGRLLSFEEKPARPKSDLAAAGVYLLGREALDAARRLEPSQGPLDLGLHLIGGFAGRAHGLELRGLVVDIGTPEGYARARSAWPEVLRHVGESR